MSSPARTLILDSTGVSAAIDSLAQSIIDRTSPPDRPLALIGIHSRGVPLAQRLGARISLLLGKTIPVGTLDITQYRDDLSTLRDVPQLLGSDINFDIDDARVVLCDEVIYTGRSIRAALAELLDFGRPATVELAALVDRNGREFPIQPDFAAHTVSITPEQRVSVQFTEVDPEDSVYIETISPAA